MDQIRRLLASLDLKQKAAILLAAVAVVVCAIGFTRWQHERGFKPLYSGLAPDDASAVVQKLKESGVEYRVADNGATILAAEERIPELRLEMAGAGVPKSGRIGFELFDKTNLGITDFTEHVNYRRAIEGELERSVKCLNEVEQARVHVTFPRDSVFTESREPAKASVLVSLRPGTRLTAQNVAAITNMVASSVEGLTPEAVSVLDMNGNLLNRPRHASPEEAQADETLEYKDRVEKQMLAKINATLEPLLGEGRFRTSLSVDCDLTSGEQSEESFDPQKSVMATSQRTEDLMGGGSQSGGVPGTASNLPQPPSRSSSAGPTTSRRTENITYQTSRVVRHVKLPEGVVKRVSASILLDQEASWQGQGKQRARVLVPPSPEKIKTIHDLVAAAIGLVPDRGDQLIIESLPFETTLHPEPLPPAENPRVVPLQERLRTDRGLQIGVGAAVLLGAILMILMRRLLSANKHAAVVTSPTALPPPTSSVDLKTQAEQADAAAKRAVQEQLESQQQKQQQLLAEMQDRLKIPDATRKVEALKVHLTDSVKKDAAFAANVLRGWIEEDGKA